MPMFATAANLLEVVFDSKNSITFKMHADLSMDTLRWLRDQIKRLEVMGKRADKIEAKAVDEDDDAQFEQLTNQAEGLRSKGGDELDVMCRYVKRASNGWTDYYADADAQANNDPLPFEESNIARIGVIKLNKVINAFNLHYGLAEEDGAGGKAKGESLPEPSPSETVAALSPNGTVTT